MKRILVLGVGAQGSTVAKRMDEEKNVTEIICADYDEKAVIPSITWSGKESKQKGFFPSGGLLLLLTLTCLNLLMPVKMER